MKRLTKRQTFKNTENNYLSYLKQHEMMLESHAEFRKAYGRTVEVEANFKKEVDLGQRRLKELKSKMDKAKAELMESER